MIRPRRLSEHEIDLWLTNVAGIAGSSRAARQSSVASRRDETWATCASIVHSYDRHGRLDRPPGAPPVISGTELVLSLAHAGSILAIAVSRRRSIGVDAEPHDARADISLARHALTTRELAACARLDPSRRREALVRAWVRKEAVLKAAGVGLLVEPSLVEVGIGLLPVDEAVVPGVGRFRIVDLAIPGYAVTLAAEGPAPIRVRRCGPAPAAARGGRRSATSVPR